MTLQAMDDRRTVQPPNAQTPRWLEKLEFKRQARAIPIENTLTNTKQFSLCRIILLFIIYICSFVHYTLNTIQTEKKNLVISFTKVKGVIRFINPSKLLVKYLNLKFWTYIEHEIFRSKENEKTWSNFLLPQVGVPPCPLVWTILHRMLIWGKINWLIPCIQITLSTFGVHFLPSSSTRAQWKVGQ